ncbi:MAG: hypothetical protein GEV11_09990 [Streptosporangiales bacterium]|nr:hypothetical protein [Streptosporangiales bacterium]
MGDRRPSLPGGAWLFVHLPLLIALAVASVGIEHAVSADAAHVLSAPERWMLLGPVAAYLPFEAVICFTTK